MKKRQRKKNHKKLMARIRRWRTRIKTGRLESIIIGGSKFSSFKVPNGAVEKLYRDWDKQEQAILSGGFTTDEIDGYPLRGRSFFEEAMYGLAVPPNPRFRPGLK